MTLGETLKFFRKKNNYTQKDISKYIGIKQNTYSGYENDINEPDIETLKKLADLYMVSLDMLCGRIPITQANINIKSSITIERAV